MKTVKSFTFSPNLLLLFISPPVHFFLPLLILIEAIFNLKLICCSAAVQSLTENHQTRSSIGKGSPYILNAHADFPPLKYPTQPEILHQLQVPMRRQLIIIRSFRISDFIFIMFKV